MKYYGIMVTDFSKKWRPDTETIAMKSLEWMLKNDY